MISIDNALWQKLTKPSGDSLIARKALPELTDQLLIALDSFGNRHILINLGRNDVSYSDAQSRGIKVVTRELSIQGENINYYLDVECIDTSGYSVFNIIGGEIGQGISNSENDPFEVIKSILSKWRRFFSSNKPVLSKDDLVGLFGELWFLSKWLIPSAGPVSMFAWRGPQGSRHDFEWPGLSIEVKTTSSNRGHIHTINGLDQLDPPILGKLYVFSLCVKEEIGGLESLYSLIMNCRNLLTNNSAFLSGFEDSLANLGVFEPLYNEFSNPCFRVTKEILYYVTNDFPRLSSINFLGGVPSGIERISYEINLNSFSHLVYSDNPDTFDFEGL